MDIDNHEPNKLAQPPQAYSSPSRLQISHKDIRGRAFSDHTQASPSSQGALEQTCPSTWFTSLCVHHAVLSGVSA